MSTRTGASSSSAPPPPEAEPGRGRLLPLLRHLVRLVFFRLIPTLVHAIRVRVVRLVQRIVRLVFIGIHLSLAAALAAWLLLSAWWIAGGVAIGAWTATVAVATGRWCKSKVQAAYRWWRSWWLGSAADASAHGKPRPGLRDRLFWWRGYLLWPFLWLGGWRRQRMRHRTQANRGRTTPASRSPNASPHLATADSPSLSASSPGTSGVTTPRSASPTHMPRVASPSHHGRWRSSPTSGMRHGRSSPHKPMDAMPNPFSPPPPVAAAATATPDPHYGLGVHLPV
ncbi:hypothetical protein THASP1DRAFT_32221 [Thamnocephalis sphaerospora]|uniref:Uncharacterized protein n=1 Tax=Thamnocephalis sphaerospora TaxID=78915 RepID=A0A4V1IW12_9FUNG|nr:hypothetical protein THASP1DRAFT_32221 [Thamnocephalis sphaerospora]|eukprot:RKP05949.1 hypothetical protein THASP1DRAFT_32221 [Thamnocephalis sphaerospora]